MIKRKTSHTSSGLSNQIKYSLLILIILSTSCQSSQETTFIILPDTQTYLEAFPEVFESQVDWIIQNKEKIDAVIQVGDITQDNHTLEWAVMSKYFSEFEKAGVAYTFSLGNHDMGSAPRKSADIHDTSLANKYFPISRFKNKKYMGESQHNNLIDNHYIQINSGGIDWLIFSFEFGPSDETLDWANKVIANNPHKIVIINTHAYLYSDSTLHDEGDKWLPQIYGIGKDTTRTVNNGKQIWDKLVSQHPNIIAVFCGHVLNGGVGTLVSTGKNGNKVYQMLANYQRGVHNSEYGGNGYLRIVTFDAKNNNINVKTYSTWEDKYHPSKEHNFIFEDVDISNYINANKR